jgi:diacylglycerol kinase family enzyme
VNQGADALAMAGGDGSQAIVAMIAAELALPYACIPAGTRNHFALELGVDRDDVVGALNAFVNGGERRVDWRRSTTGIDHRCGRDLGTDHRPCKHVGVGCDRRGG